VGHSKLEAREDAREPDRHLATGGVWASCKVKRTASLRSSSKSRLAVKMGKKKTRTRASKLFLSLKKHAETELVGEAPAPSRGLGDKNQGI